MKNYSINLNWSDEDLGYIATVPEFPYLSAYGETKEEALKEAGIALELIIEDMKEEGALLPEINKVESYSGQLRLRMPKTLHKQLASDAKREGQSLNSYLVYLLSTRRLNNIIDKCGKEISYLPSQEKSTSATTFNVVAEQPNFEYYPKNPDKIKEM